MKAGDRVALADGEEVILIRPNPAEQRAIAGKRSWTVDLDPEKKLRFPHLGDRMIPFEGN